MWVAGSAGFPGPDSRDAGQIPESSIILTRRLSPPLTPVGAD